MNVIFCEVVKKNYPGNSSRYRLQLAKLCFAWKIVDINYFNLRCCVWRDLINQHILVLRTLTNQKATN